MTTESPETAAEVGVQVQRLVSNEYCFGCSQMRPCLKTGTYRYDGKDWPIWVCQWCRAATTKRKKRGPPA